MMSCPAVAFRGAWRLAGGRCGRGVVGNGAGAAGATARLALRPFLATAAAPPSPQPLLLLPGRCARVRFVHNTTTAAASLAGGGGTQQQQQQQRQGSAASATAAAAAAATTDGASHPAAQQPQQQPQKQQQPQQPQQRHQTLDYSALAACVAELQAKWVPSKVEEVAQPDAYTLSLRLRTPARQGWLHLSWHPTAARVCAGAPRPPRGGASEAFSFARAAEQQLKGLALVGARLPRAWERVAALEFGPRPGEAARIAYCEVMANYSNVVLADAASGAVLAAARQVGGKMSSLRQVQQGRAYALPPVTAGVAPSLEEPLEAWRDVVTRAAELAAGGGGGDGGDGSSGGNGGGNSGGRKPTVLGGCVRAYSGVSPALVSELCAAASVDAAAAPRALPDDGWRRLHAEWRRWLARVADGAFAPSLDEARGAFSMFGGCATPYESAHEMLEAYYSRLQAAELHRSLHQKLTAAARGALKKARARAGALAAQLEAAGAADGVQRAADIIMANVYRCVGVGVACLPDLCFACGAECCPRVCLLLNAPAFSAPYQPLLSLLPPSLCPPSCSIEEGATALEAEDWDTGAPVKIALDPSISAVEQAEALYKRARKLRRAVGAVAPLLEAARGEVEYLEQVRRPIPSPPPPGPARPLLAPALCARSPTKH